MSQKCEATIGFIGNVAVTASAAFGSIIETRNVFTGLFQYTHTHNMASIEPISHHHNRDTVKIYKHGLLTIQCIYWYKKEKCIYCIMYVIILYLFAVSIQGLVDIE